MKRVRVTCDRCGKRQPTCHGEYERASVRMVTWGYGFLDGDHRGRWHICSPECGLALLKHFIREIEAGEELPLDS